MCVCAAWNCSRARKRCGEGVERPSVVIGPASHCRVRLGRYGQVVEAFPSVLGCSLENIQEHVELLRNIGVREEKLGKVRWPDISPRGVPCERVVAYETEGVCA